MKQRVELRRDGLYYPQYKFMFWWVSYTDLTRYNPDGYHSKKIEVSFKTEAESLSFLNVQFNNSIAKEPIAWITWNRPE